MNDTSYPARLATFHQWAQLLCGAGAAVIAAGLWLAPGRVWPDVLLGSFALVCLGVAGLFFVALQYASGAVWSIALRRVGEAMTAALPAGAVGVLAVLIVRPALYPWYAHLAVHAEGWAGFKQAWLSYPSFLARTVMYLAVWMWFAWALRNNSRRQDLTRESGLSRKNTRLAVAFMVVFGVTFWLACTDWVMSLEPDWASTIFAFYHFSGMFVAGLAAISLLALTLRRAGPLSASVQDAHLLDLGRLLVAFSTFWAYIWFSQYMLIWYANLSDETPYMALRTGPGWGKLFVANLLLNWAVPFLLLLPRANKVNPRTLALAAVTLLVGRFTDLYLMILPPFSPNHPWPGIWELGTVSLVASGFALLTLRAFSRAEPVPVGDPLLAESIHGRAA
jgi:hypothetical protein